jgi:anti-sigma B factor antagonist
VELAIERRDSVCIVRVRGDFDISTIGDAQRTIHGAVTNHDHAMVLDLTESGFVDSAGVNTIFALGEALADRQLAMALVVPPGGLVARVFEIVDVSQVAAVHPTLDAAMGAVD